MRPVLYRLNVYNESIDGCNWYVVDSIYSEITRTYHKIYYCFNSFDEAKRRFPSALYDPEYREK